MLQMSARGSGGAPMRKFCDVIGMHADKVEVSWDDSKHKWQVRIQAGAEAIRRHCAQPRDTDEEKLRSAAHETVVDEGYEFELSRISVMR